jgi:hypothetical protein
MMKKKGELVFDELIPWIIVLGTLILVLVLYFVLSGKGNSAIDYFKNLWRFGR